MAYQVVQCFRPRCDLCGELYVNGDGFSPHYRSMVEIDNLLNPALHVFETSGPLDDGWIKLGTDILCEKCKVKEHEFIPAGRGDDEECLRCGWMERHPASSAKSVDG